LRKRRLPPPWSVEEQSILTAGGKAKKEKAAEAASEMLHSVVALPPSIDVPRTIAIGLTDAALYGPTRSATVPCVPSAVVIVIVMMARADVDLECRGRDCARNANCADDT
jgi:hypothetical protein